MSDWSGWAEMTAWKRLWESEWTAFIVTTSKRNVLRDLVTLSLALHSQLRLIDWPSTPCTEPMKESNETRDCVMVWNGNSVGWKVRGLRFLSACLLHLVHYAWWKQKATIISRPVHRLPFLIHHVVEETQLTPPLFLYLVSTCSCSSVNTTSIHVCHWRWLQTDTV